MRVISELTFRITETDAGEIAIDSTAGPTITASYVKGMARASIGGTATYDGDACLVEFTLHVWSHKETIVQVAEEALALKPSEKP